MKTLFPQGYQTVFCRCHDTQGLTFIAPFYPNTAVHCIITCIIVK